MRTWPLALLLLTGCATTLADVRATEPLRQASIQTRHTRQQLAACTMEQMELHGGRASQLVFRILETPAGVTSMSGAMSGSIVFEAQFSTQVDRVRVETRTDGGFLEDWIARKVERENFWPAVEQCSGTKTGAAR